MVFDWLRDLRQQLWGVDFRYERRRSSVRRKARRSIRSVESLEQRVLLSATCGDDLHVHTAGADVPLGMFTPDEITFFESVVPDSSLSTKTPVGFSRSAVAAQDGSHAPDTLTFVVDFKESGQANTTDIFGNVVSTFDVTAYGFANGDFNTVANSIMAEIDEDYFTELVGTVAGPAGQDLAVDFVIGDIGTAPAGISEYYYVQVGTGISGPHSGGTLGVASGSAVRNTGGTGPNNGMQIGDVVSSVFTDAIVALSGLTPANALTSGNLGFTTNAIAGTLSHEIGHTVSLSHIDKAGSVQLTGGVSPLMGTGAIDLPNNDRIGDREFSLSGTDSQSGGAAVFHIPQLVGSVGLHSTEVVNTAEIRGQKWNDLDGDGVRDANELPLNGWTIQLFSSVGTLVGTQVTADVDLDSSGTIDPQTESGVYVFTELAAGSYTIGEVQQTGWTQTAPITSDVFIQDFETALGANETTSGSFSINAANATLNNGTQMMGHATSYGNNEYSFYEVALDLTGRNDVRLQFDYAAHIENTFDGFNVQASVAAINPPGDLITPLSGMTYDTLNPDFGLVAQIGTSGYDSNGAVDTGQAVFDLSAFDGQTVNVRLQFGTDDSVTNPGINLDNIRVFENGAVFGAHAVTLIEGQLATELDFGNQQQGQNNGEIRGQKWNDLDNDGVRDAAEPGLNGWVIQLFDNGGTLLTTQTTADADLDNSGTIDPITESGLYAFTGLAAGTYTVGEVSQPGWTQTSPAGGGSSDPNGFNVAKLSQFDLSAFSGGNTSGNDITGYVSPSGREYAIIGLSHGTGYIDVTNPSNPSIVAFVLGPDEGLPATTHHETAESHVHLDKGASTWRDIKTFAQHAYVTNETSGGLQVVDLTQIDSGVVTSVGTLTDSGLQTAHNIAINPDSGFAYLLGANIAAGGLVVVDLATNPAAPTIVGTWSERYLHDAEIVSYTSGPSAGREIAYGFAETEGLKVIDVTDKAAMVTLATVPYPNVTYSHYGTLSTDQQHLFVNDELDERDSAGVSTTTTYVFDISTPATPAFLSSFTNGNAAIDHNLETRGNFLFEANYTSGLRVFDVSDVNNIQETGYYDTFPASDATEFNGAWGVYADLPSGIVLVSDFNSGLFVLDVTQATTGTPLASSNVVHEFSHEHSHETGHEHSDGTDHTHSEGSTPHEHEHETGHEHSDGTTHTHSEGSTPHEHETGHEHYLAAAYYVPPRRALSNPDGWLSDTTAGAPLDIALTYLQSQAGQLGLTTAELNQYVVTDQYRSESLGVTHIYLRQLHGGLPVIGADININVSDSGQVLNAYSAFIGGLATADTPAPALSAAQALQAMASELGLSTDIVPAMLDTATDVARSSTLLADEIARSPVSAELVYVPTSKGGVRLAWKLNLETVEGDHWFDGSVSADTGEMVGLTDWVSHATYNVYAAPNESPSDGNRTLEVDPAEATASPFGWHDTNGATGAEFTITQGNNVTAYADRNDDNAPDTGSQPNGTSSLEFDFPVNLGLAPSTYQNAAVTNLFYWNNILHDVHYAYGFNEAAGNFQTNNYGNGGTGGDAVQAEAQDGADAGNANNANFATPPDGSAPRMQMYTWTAPTPDRDGDFDNGIIIHEYGHGVSNRLTGGPSNSGALNAQQSGGMGEGWGDWHGLMLTQIVTDAANDPRGIGTYALNQPTTGAGIRTQRYSYDMSVNTHTYGSITSGLSVPHGVGEVWATTLWDLNWALIGGSSLDPNLTNTGLGFDPDLINGTGGNNLAMQLVMDGMKLQPSSPTFLDARDAILAADQAANGGANQDTIWRVFARRGMGFNANDGGSANTVAVTEAFDLPATSTGTIELNATSYEVGTSVGITVRDIDLSAAATNTITLSSSGGDTETVTLTSGGAGVFTATVATSASGTAENGTLNVVAGDTITATYNDADTGSGAAAVVTDTASVVSFFNVLVQDFESGLGGNESVSGTFVINNTNTTLNNGTQMMGHPGSAYGDNEYSFYELAVDLTGFTGNQLQFDYAGHIEAGWDGFNVQASTAPISPPGNLITPISGLPYSTLSAGAVSQLGTTAYDSGGAVNTGVAVFDLSAFDGQTVNLRLQFGSDTSVTRPGINIDNLRIRATGTDGGPPSNQSPTLDAITPLTVQDDAGLQTVSFTGVTAGTGETQPLAVSVNSSNTTVVPTPAVNYTTPDTTGSLAFSPVSGQTGTSNVTVTVTDGGPDGNLATTGDNATVSQSFVVTVIPSGGGTPGSHSVTLSAGQVVSGIDFGNHNATPTANAGPAQSVAEGNVVTLDGSASADPESQSLTFAWTQSGGTTVTLSDANAAQPTFTAPQLLADETLTFQLVVSDGVNASAAASVLITVTADNDNPTFYFSVLNNTVVGGLSVADEDVIAFNGTDFSLLFDGSDVGLGSFDIDALSVISETEILMSFNTAGTIGGLAMDDSDIVLFTASSLGTVTAGTFEMYLDGSDVGLSSNGEDIDGFQLLSNGNLLISTQGSFSGTGASGSDEDIFEFTPTSLGNATAGSFSIYFDGSDVGLGGSGSRDIDGFAILNEQLHLTTAGTLSITGAAGNDEDVFIFNPTSLGSATSGSFESALFFDGSLFGIGGTDVNAIDLPGSVGVVDQSPTVNITAPSDGNTLTGNVTITADASDDDAVTQVEFFADGSSIGVDTNASDGWSAVWNSNGVSDGSYSLTATATDSASQTASDSIQVTVNNIDDLPTVSVLQPAEGALLANTVTVTASANDDNGVQQVEFFAGATSIGVDTNSSDGWSVSWDTTAGADGAHVITATATDTASQTGDSSVVNVIVDNTAPVISISGPTAGSTESGTITVSASANDTTSDVTQVEFFVNGNSIGVDTNASDGWSVLWDTTTVTNGTYDLTAEATDTAGNSSTASAVQITVDELPTVSVSQPAEGALLTNTVTVNASANDDNGVTQVEFFTGATSIGVDTNSSDGWSVSWDTTAGADGAHVITATATDTASQTGDSSVVNVIVDNTAPVISILGPTAGSTESGTITVSASANDTTSDVTQVEFFVNGNSIGVDTNVSDGWSVPWDTTTVTNGTYDLTAEATDTAGNSSTASAVQITVDNIVSLQLVTYFSLQNNGSIGGLTIQNEDIIAWDGTSYSLYFDGTPYLSSVSMAAFTILSDTQILMSFNESGSVTNDDSSVVTFDDSDLLLFTATSLGASTSGTFELHFDGSDVGLTRNGEDIDSVSIDPDTGDLLISTRGTHNVPGLRGSDEDVSRFTPTSLGSVTSGSWTAYFDGSDVGLGDSGNEDVDGFAILNDQIYVSTRGNFSVPGISGNDQQIVVFNPTSLGTATAGSYDALPHFDALSNDIRGLDVRIVPGSLTAAVSGSTPASSPVTGRNAGNRSNAFRSQHSDRNQLETRSETVQTTVIPHDEVSAATIQECLPEFVWFHKYTDGSDITKDKTDSENSDSFWHDFSGISNSLQLLRPH